jgi:hypothetical protein
MPWVPPGDTDLADPPAAYFQLGACWHHRGTGDNTDTAATLANCIVPVESL